MDIKRFKKLAFDFILKTLIVAIITLILLIIMKNNLKFKTVFYKYVYDTNISFNKFNNLYNKYFKDFNIKSLKETESVSSDKIDYNSKEKYNDGVKLSVSNNYSVGAQESGIIVFKGKKEKYGDTVIVQQINGIDLWYGNMENINVELYDYIEKGSLIGSVNKKLYLVYKKNGKVLDYNEQI